MALPSILDAAHTHLFADRDKMVAAGLPEATIRHLERLRDIYNYWVTYPNKRDRDIVDELRKRYGVGDTVAREDLRLIKVILGDLHRTTKDYHRYRFLEMISAAFDKAQEKNNVMAMVAAADKYAKYMQLDKEDERASILDKVVPIVLSFTDDPEVIGIKRLPNFREKIKKMKEKYWTEATEEVDYEDVEAERLDNIFKPLLPDGITAPTGIS